MMLRSEACADDGEVLALSVMRMVMAGYATGDVACWDLAYAGAERHLCPERAGRLVAGLTVLMRSVRAHRLRDCDVLPVTCRRVTRDEHGIVALLAAARSGEPLRLSRAAFALVGHAAPPVERAARVVASVIDEAGTADLHPIPVGAPIGDDAGRPYRGGVGAWQA